MQRRIVLIGATGFFGQRLAQRLAALNEIDLVVTSRDAGRSATLAQRLSENRRGASVDGIAFERGDEAGIARLKSLAPWLVIDASGPFQSCGYDLALSVVDLGTHWIDLADARGYLLGFGPALDGLARQRGVVALAGASSTPCLSHAVVESLTSNWRRIDSVDAAIMPGGAGEVGEAVIRAILSYAGEPISAFNEGKAALSTGWGTVKHTKLNDLGRRTVSPVETVDADIMPKSFGVKSRVTFAAGLESHLEQFGLVLLAKLRAARLIGRLEPLAPLLEKARRVTRLFASDRGGMTVDCTGIDPDGRHATARWSLIAERGEGPNVPVLPAVALTRALLAGGVQPGARIAAGAIALRPIESEMAGLAISTGRAIIIGNGGLFEKAAGRDAYAALPKSLQKFHDENGAPVWAGMGDIEGPQNFAGRMLSKVFGFPPGGRDIPVIVTVDRQSGSEKWTRNFGGKRFHSNLAYEGGDVVSERFGPFRILMKIVAADGAITMPVVGWRLGPLPLPSALAPHSDAREFEDSEGRFRFDVGISAPVFGRIAHYQGWLKPSQPPQL